MVRNAKRRRDATANLLSDDWLPTPGRRWLRPAPEIKVNANIRMTDRHGNTISAIYIGSKRHCQRTYDYFRMVDAAMPFRLNDLVRVTRGRRLVARYLVVDYVKPSRQMILLREDRIPCID